jgi:hypothetical protein
MGLGPGVRVLLVPHGRVGPCEQIWSGRRGTGVRQPTNDRLAKFLPKLPCIRSLDWDKSSWSSILHAVKPTIHAATSFDS